MYTHVPPSEIEKRSLEIIDSEVAEKPFEGEEWTVARRMVHTSADFELLQHIRFHPQAIAAGKEAVRQGCSIVTDTEMARVGIPMRRLDPLGCTVRCFMNDPAVLKLAKAEHVTRAWAAVDVAMATGGADIFVIGNAPTALFRLLEWIGQGARPPRLVVGMPVGFVNAAEAKDLLLAQDTIPYVSIQGRKGGSALAACVINALAKMVQEEMRG